MVLGRPRNPPAVNTPPDTVSEPPGNSIDSNQKVVALLQNHRGRRTPKPGRDLASLVGAASRAAQVRQINVDPVYAASAMVNNEIDAALKLLLQIFVPHILSHARIVSAANFIETAAFCTKTPESAVDIDQTHVDAAVPSAHRTRAVNGSGGRICAFASFTSVKCQAGTGRQDDEPCARRVCRL